MPGRGIDLSFGITFKDVSHEDLEPLVEIIRRLAGDGRLVLDPRTRRFLQRHAPDPLALETGDGKRGAAGSDGRGVGVPAAAAVADGPGALAAEDNVLGKLVRALRLERGLSQEVLGRQVGIGDSHLSKIELGKSVPHDLLCERIARAFGCDPSRLRLAATASRVARAARLAQSAPDQSRRRP